MKNSPKKSSGFTLIELMIVVAIIGLLSSIAIPNFLKFIAKARQSEARTNLGAIYVAQMSYFGTAGTFAGKTDSKGLDAFAQIGWDPRSPGVMRYAFIMDEAIILPGHNPPSSLPPAIASSEFGFTAIAAGNIDSDPFVDVWGINDQKIIENRVPDASGWGADGSDIQN